jgi:1,4-dihydroxy-2-naphthoyl-CoA synthase
MIEEGVNDNNSEAISAFKLDYYGEDFKEGAKVFREKRKPKFK